LPFAIGVKPGNKIIFYHGEINRENKVHINYIVGEIYREGVLKKEELLLRFDAVDMQEVSRGVKQRVARRELIDLLEYYSEN